MPALDLKRELGLLSRFGGAGLVTTAVGGAVILGLDVGLHLDPRLANAAGYLVGAALGFVLQKLFVFGGQDHARGVTGRYLAVMLLAFALNQSVLVATRQVLPATPVGHGASQLLAMATYTASQFILFRLWVFRPAA